MNTAERAKASRGTRPTSHTDPPTMKGIRPRELATASATVDNAMWVPLIRTPHHIAKIVAVVAKATARSPLATTLNSQATRRGPVANATSRRPLTSSLAAETIHDTAKNAKATDITTEER